MTYLTRALVRGLRGAPPLTAAELIEHECPDTRRGAGQAQCPRAADGHAVGCVECWAREIPGPIYDPDTNWEDEV